MVGAGRRSDIYLQPGQYFVGDAKYWVHTVLGSCVSITLWSAARKIGAMSHFVLRSRAGNETFPPAPDGRFGDEALVVMLEKLASMGVAPGDCEAKVFGGGNMFPDVSMENRHDIGRDNGNAARTLLQEHAIPVVSQSLFGVGHRQVIFDIASGEVWARQVPPIELVVGGARYHGTDQSFGR